MCSLRWWHFLSSPGLAARGERLCASIKASAARGVDETKVWRDERHRSAENWLAAKTGETAGADPAPSATSSMRRVRRA